MPRIRSLKPEHRQHRKVGPLSDRAYRLWVGMVLEADDDGRLVADPAFLRASVFTYQGKLTLRHISEALAELATVGLLRLYCVDGICYADFPSWADHQKIDRKTASKLPPYDDSTSVRRAFDERSTDARYGSEGSEGSRSEGSERRLADAARPAPSTNGPVFQIPPSVATALSKSPRLGADARINSAGFWQAEVRANNGLNFAAEVLKAEAWMTANPRKAPRAELPRFLHTWLARAHPEEGA